MTRKRNRSSDLLVRLRRIALLRAAAGLMEVRAAHARADARLRCEQERLAGLAGEGEQLARELNASRGRVRALVCGEGARRAWCRQWEDASRDREQAQRHLQAAEDQVAERAAQVRLAEARKQAAEELAFGLTRKAQRRSDSRFEEDVLEAWLTVACPDSGHPVRSFRTLHAPAPNCGSES